MSRSDYIYLDHAAATPVDRRVLEAMMPYFSENFFNPSSPYAPAVLVRRDFEDAKSRLAKCIGVKADEIAITAGATESINLAFSGVGGQVVTSEIEHPAVLNAARQYEHIFVKPNSKGVVEAAAFYAAIGPETELVSLALANNELGTLQPVREVAMIVETERKKRLAAGDSRPILLHCDASQGAGQIEIQASRLGVDLLTLNAGKVYGPKQVGLLWVRPGVEVTPIVQGGGQERGLRSGTENVAGAVGFAKALELATEHRKSESERLAGLRDKLQQSLASQFDDMEVSGNQKKRLPGHLHVAWPGLDAERLVFLLEMKGVMVATGSACAANKGTRSHVLSAIGMAPELADGSLRLTLGRLSTAENIARASELIAEAVRSEKARLGL